MQCNSFEGYVAAAAESGLSLSIEILTATNTEMPRTAWSYESLQSMISDQVEESLVLDYKAASALGRTDSKKTEITKDVAAFANSAGGVIIYGIREHDDPSKRHLPQAIDPIDRTQFSKEWLEHVIGGIRPRILEVSIHPVPVPGNDARVVYVVEIPQGNSAHQSGDFRYYRRFNFESVPMYDHEIRDVNARGQHPILSLTFELHGKTVVESLLPGVPYPRFEEPRTHESFSLKICAHNKGNKYAEYINAFVEIPSRLLLESRRLISVSELEAKKTSVEKLFFDNTHRDVVGMELNYPKYGPSRFDPLLPQLTRSLGRIELDRNFDRSAEAEVAVKWIVYADNAPPVSGQIKISEIPFIDRRSKNGKTPPQ